MSGRNKIISLSGRLAIVCMILFYTIASVGILKTSHFCMGRETSVVFFSAESHSCPCSVFEEEAMDCCYDEQGFIQLKDDQQVQLTLQLPEAQRFVLEELFPLSPLRCIRDSRHAHHPINDAPPPRGALFKIYCSLVFYDDESIF